MSDITGTEGLGSALDDDALDLEIQQNEAGLAELLDGNNQNGELHTNVKTGDLATIRGGLAIPDVVAKASVEWDQKGSIQQEVQRLYAELRTELAGATVTAAQAAPDNAPALVADMTTGMTAIDGMQQHPLANELAVIQRAAQVPLAQAARERGAFHIAARNDIIALLDEQGMADKLLDFAGIFVPARGALEWEDVKAGVSADKQLSAFLSGESIASLVTSFQQLPVDRMEAIWPSLRDLVLDASGLTEVNDPNIMMATGMLLAFLEPEGGGRAKTDVIAELGLEALSAVPGAIKTIKGIRTARQLSRVKATNDLPPRDKSKVPTMPNEVAFAPPQVINDISALVATQPLPLRKAMESVMLSTGELAVKEHNIIKVLAKAGDSKEAARMNIAAMSDQQVAKAIGITSDEAVQNMMPFQTKEWLPQIVEGLMPETGKALNNFYRSASKQVAGVTTEANRMRIGATHQIDRANQVKSFHNEVERVGEDILSDGYILDDIKITGESTESFTFEYTLRDTTVEGGGKTIQGRRSWKAGRVGGDYSATAEDLAGPNASSIPGQSPTAWSVTKPGSATDFNDTAKQAIQLHDLKTAVHNDVAQLWVEANADVSGVLGRKQRDQLNALDIEGDEFINPETAEVGKVFLPEELLAKGIDDPKVIEAYYKRRILADAMHSMQNYSVRREYELLGFNRSVIVGQGEDAAQLFVKAYDDVNAARSALAGKEQFNIFDPATRKVFSASADHIDRVYADGRQIVRSHADWNTSGNDLNRGAEHVEYIAVGRQDVAALPEQVIHYKAGYVPKRNEGIEVVVQRIFKIKKQGQTNASTQEAMRAFASRSDAEAFRTNLVQEHAAKHNIPLDEAEELYALADGSVMSQINRATNSLSGSKGLFRGTRAKDELLMGLEGRPLERMQPEEVMGRWLDHVAGGATQNEWRIGKEQEWINTVQRAGLEVKGFDGTKLPNDDIGKALGKLRDQIRSWNSVPSRKESLFEASVQRTHDWVLDGTRRFGNDSDRIPGILPLKRAPEAFTAYAKTAAMHAMLGALNPAQIYVQGSAMSVALSLADPKDWANIIQTSARMGMLDNVQDTNLWGKTLRGLGGRADVPADMQEMYTSWERSGLRESIRGNADLNYTSSTGLGVSRDLLRKSENVSLMFYRSGEIMNRRVSYLSAFKQWRTANPKAVIDDAAESDILRAANLNMMELNGANRAWFQGGPGTSVTQQVAAMSTQFMQVMTKTVELSFKGEARGGFTTAQKKRIALGQIALFGSAGVPLVSLVGPSIAGFIADGMGPEADTPEGQEFLAGVANTLNQGFVGFLTREVVGADVQVASRAALGLGVLETIKDIWTSEDPVWSRLLGPSGEVAARLGETAEQVSLMGQSSQMFKALESIEPMLLGTRAQSEEINRSDLTATMSFIKDAMIIAGSTIPTTGRNILKARIMSTQNEIYSRRGAVRIREDFNLQTEFGTALGFTPTEDARLYTVQNLAFSNKEHMQESVETMLRVYHRYVFMYNRDPAYGKDVVRAKQIIEESFNNPKLAQDFNSRLESRILHNNETAQDRALAEFFKTVLTEEVTAGYILDQGSIGNMLTNTPVIVPFKDVQSAPDVEE